MIRPGLTIAVVALTCAAACGTTPTDADLALNNGSGATAAAPIATVPPAAVPAVPPPATPAVTAGVTSGVPPVAVATSLPPISPVSAGAAYRDVTIAAGTVLPLSLLTSLASETSVVEDPVAAELTKPIWIDGRDVLPAGARFSGFVTAVDGSGRVKGRALLAFRFVSVSTGSDQYDVQVTPFTRLAPTTLGEDATKVGIGAGAGAILGGILGGKKGAAEGAAVGGGAGVGVVLATKGQELRLEPGTDVSTELTAPLTIRLRVR